MIDRQNTVHSASDLLAWKQPWPTWKALEEEVNGAGGEVACCFAQQ